MTKLDFLALVLPTLAILFAFTGAVLAASNVSPTACAPAVCAPACLPALPPQ